LLARAVEACEEYVFLDRLEYLAAGGGYLKPKAFRRPAAYETGDQPYGRRARQVGLTRNRQGQIEFALQRIEKKLRDVSFGMIFVAVFG